MNYNWEGFKITVRFCLEDAWRSFCDGCHVFWCVVLPWILALLLFVSAITAIGLTVANTVAKLSPPVKSKVVM